MQTLMKLETRLFLGFLSTALITLSLGVIGYYSIIRGGQSLSEIGKARLPSLNNLLIIKNEAERIRGTMRTLAIPGLPPDIRGRQAKNLADSRKAYEAAFGIYEKLPQTPGEADVWKQFAPAWKAWESENEKYLDIAQHIEKTGIADPMALGRQVESLAKDHYRLAEKVLALMLLHQNFDGGEDPEACNAGKWMASFQTKNPDLTEAIKAIQSPHKKFHESVGKIKAAYKQGDTEAMRLIYASQTGPAMQETRRLFEAMTKAVDDAASLFREGNGLLLGSNTDRMRTAIEILGKVAEANITAANQKVEETEHQAVFFKLFSVIATVLGVVLAMGVGFLINRSISRILSRVSRAIDEGAHQVASASGEVSDAAQTMAEGASRQAAAIEETSSSLEEMSSMTQRNAENAGHANGLMKESGEVMSMANSSMIKLTASMEDISKAAEETSKIIKTIDEIAFQTNLLALNASVEAARAGEAGAGFAVVANEVRNLATRAAASARDTAGLIEGTVQKVSQGTVILASTNEAFQKVAGSSNQISALIGEIAEASREQATGIEEVNLAIAEMDKVVQQNAANAEESASAAEEMNAQAQQLKEFVDELMVLAGGKKGDK